jgi:NTE family protein
MAEMRAIAFVQRLVADGSLIGEESKRLKHMNIHMIGDEERLSALGATSKMNAELDFLLHLKSLGQNAADGWLRENWGHIGNRSSIDVRSVFLTAEPSSSPSASSGPGGPSLVLPHDGSPDDGSPNP